MKLLLKIILAIAIIWLLVATSKAADLCKVDPPVVPGGKTVVTCGSNGDDNMKGACLWRNGLTYCFPTLEEALASPLAH